MHLTARGCVIALMSALGMIVLFFWVTGVNASNANPPPPPTPEAAKPPPVVTPAPPPAATAATAATPAASTAKAEPAPAPVNRGFGGGAPDGKKPASGMKAALLAPPGKIAPTSHVKKQPKSKMGKQEHAMKHSGKPKKTAKRAHH